MNELLIENAMNELAGCCPPTLAGSLADALTAFMQAADLSAGDSGPAALGDTAEVKALVTAAQAGDRTFLDPEKVVWDWADLGGRIVEELR